MRERCLAKTVQVISDLESRTGTLVCFKMGCTDGRMKKELMDYKLLLALLAMYDEEEFDKTLFTGEVFKLAVFKCMQYQENQLLT